MPDNQKLRRRPPVPSPLAKLLQRSFSKIGIETKTEYPVGPFFVDLMLTSYRLGIECDGFTSHSTEQQQAKDQAVQRYLNEKGYLIIRFAGSEICSDPNECVRQTLRIIKGFNR